MDQETAAEFVIKELGKHHSRNEIIVALCENMEINWPEAEQFLREIEQEHGREITARQSPLIIVLGLGLLIVGLGLTCYNSFFFYDFFQSQHTGFTVDNALEMRAVFYRTVSLVAGIAMIVGGIMGSWKSIASLLKE